MSVTLYWTFQASVAAALVALLLLAWRHRSWGLLFLVGLVAAISAVASYVAPGFSTTRDVSVDGSPAVGGGIQEIAAVTLCYFSMLLGMMAEYAYVQAEQGKKRLQFVPMTFVMPILASPIVFIPLLTLAGDLSTGAFTRAKLMVYLVAFQNGFFWKNFFEQRRREAT